MKLFVRSCALLFVSTVASAQTPSPIPAPVMSGAVLHTGTEVPLKLSEMLTTKGKVLKAGQRIHLEVAEPVMVNGVVVIPAGSLVMGEITEVRNKGMWGKSGHFAGRVLYTTVNGRQLRLTGVFDDKGTAGGVGAVAASAVLIPVAGFFMTGTSAKLEIGTPVKGFMDEDVQLAMPAVTAEPMVVGGPAATNVIVPAGAFVTPPATLRTIATTPSTK